MPERRALIVIDVQQSFIQRPYWDESTLPAFRDKLLALIAGCRTHGVPVVHILHEDGDGPFTAASGLVRIMDWLPDDADATFTKHVHNALTDSGLQPWLAARGITRLIIAGLRTEQCCETTARVASDLGYAVDFVTEATQTFAMTHAASGRVYSPDEIRAHTELVLGGRFARLHSVSSCLAALTSS
ncbi:isochorismatase family protein [Craterilacuibacter sp.]|uniref:isochorismatase family protein n=1 Tax=Craterilacuibacter sp. TaxID=2870909 RepID=UPI003F31E8B2